MIHSAYDRPEGPKLECGPGKTKQQFTKECDVNCIMAKYQKTGNLDHYNEHGAMYGEFTSVEFQEAMQIVEVAEEMFADLSSSARAKFNNDPAQFLDFVQNPDNADEMYEMGLATRPERQWQQPDNQLPETTPDPPGRPQTEPQEGNQDS